MCTKHGDPQEKRYVNKFKGVMWLLLLSTSNTKLFNC